MEKPPEARYTCVIATMNRPEKLRDTLQSVQGQELAAEAVIIVDASEDARSREVVEEGKWCFQCHYHKAREKGAAVQRNFGIGLVETPLTAFLDDDVVLQPDVMRKLYELFRQDARVGGAAGRISNEAAHRRPSRLYWLYLRLQAGFSHPDYGARLFGPGMNAYPCYDEAEPEAIEADWLNAGCVLYRTELVKKHGFPDFHGYSHGEDAYLSGMIARTHRLYFHAGALYGHYPSESSAKVDKRKLEAMKIRNMERIAREVLQVPKLVLACKLFLHRLFVSLHILRSGGERSSRLAGLWLGPGGSTR